LEYNLINYPAFTWAKQKARRISKDLAGTGETISTRQVQLPRPFGWLLALAAAVIIAHTWMMNAG
jgi:hypothetical protein